MPSELEALKRRASSISEGLSKLVHDAYEAGFTDGGLAMREHILQRANEPVAIRAGQVRLSGSVAVHTRLSGALDVRDHDAVVPENFTRLSPHQNRVASRAPRGLVREAIERALRLEPGLSIAELEKRVAISNPEIARKTVGNQLRGFEGDLYRREGKYKWFLMGEPQKETASPALPADLADLLGQLKGGEAQ